MKSKFLIFPDFEREFILDTDACLDGISGILPQEQESIELPVGNFSKALSETEIKYPIIEKELYAVMKSLKYYLIGRSFIIRSDHEPLKYLSTMKEMSQRLYNWWLAIFSRNNHLSPRKATWKRRRNFTFNSH